MENLHFQDSAEQGRAKSLLQRSSCAPCSATLLGIRLSWPQFSNSISQIESSFFSPKVVEESPVVVGSKSHGASLEASFVVYGGSSMFRNIHLFGRGAEAEAQG